MHPALRHFVPPPHTGDSTGDEQEVTVGFTEARLPVCLGGHDAIPLGAASWAPLGCLWPVLRAGAGAGRGPGACKVGEGMHPVASGEMPP